MKSLFILIIFFASSPSWAIGEFKDSFDIDAGSALETADLVSRYYLGIQALNSKQAQADLNLAKEKLNQLIQDHPQNPVLYFIKGLNASLLASLYKQSADKRFLQSIINKNSAFKKAIQLDNQKQTLLSAPAYATMKHGLPEKYKIKAIQKELAQGGSGNNESQYWYLHWSNINSLQKAGRFKEAQQALNNMQQELAQEGLSQSTYSKISAQAENNLNKAIQKKPKRTKPPSANETPTIDTKTLIIVMISIVSILAFIGIAIYEFKIKKRK